MKCEICGTESSGLHSIMACKVCEKHAANALRDYRAALERIARAAELCWSGIRCADEAEAALEKHEEP